MSKKENYFRQNKKVIKGVHKFKKSLSLVHLSELNIAMKRKIGLSQKAQVEESIPGTAKSIEVAMGSR